MAVRRTKSEGVPRSNAIATHPFSLDPEHTVVSILLVESGRICLESFLGGLRGGGSRSHVISKPFKDSTLRSWLHLQIFLHRYPSKTETIVERVRRSEFHCPVCNKGHMRFG